MPLFSLVSSKIMIWSSTTIYFTVIGWLCRYIHDRHFSDVHGNLGALTRYLIFLKRKM